MSAHSDTLQGSRKLQTEHQVHQENMSTQSTFNKKTK